MIHHDSGACGAVCVRRACGEKREVGAEGAGPGLKPTFSNGRDSPGLKTGAPTGALREWGFYCNAAGAALRCAQEAETEFSMRTLCGRSELLAAKVSFESGSAAQGLKPGSFWSSGGTGEFMP